MPPAQLRSREQLSKQLQDTQAKLAAAQLQLQRADEAQLEQAAAPASHAVAPITEDSESEAAATVIAAPTLQTQVAAAPAQSGSSNGKREHGNESGGEGQSPKRAKIDSEAKRDDEADREEAESEPNGDEGSLTSVHAACVHYDLQLQTISKSDYATQEAQNAVDMFNTLVTAHQENQSKCDVGKAQDLKKASDFLKKLKNTNVEEHDNELKAIASGIATAMELSTTLLALLP